GDANIRRQAHYPPAGPGGLGRKLDPLRSRLVELGGNLRLVNRQGLIEEAIVEPAERPRGASAERHVVGGMNPGVVIVGNLLGEVLESRLIVGRVDAGTTRREV